MSGNITTTNNLVCSGNLTISNNIINNGNLQTIGITSSSINNTNSITTNTINSTNASLTNASISNILTLLSNTPVLFNYNGSNYNLSSLMLYTLQQLAGQPIASQSYVQTEISNLINGSPNLLNTLDELANAINDDANFATTVANNIATKGGLTQNNTFSGANIFNNSNGNIIDRLFSTVLSINNGNTRRNVANCFEVGIGQTSSYIYYDNSGKFGSVNTNNSSLSWNIALDGTAIIPTINSTTGTIANLYSNILAVNNNNTRRAANDIFEVATSSTGNYLYYNNSSTFGHINTSDSNMSWFINSSGSATIPTINLGTLNVSTASTFQNLPNFVNTSDKLINKNYVDNRFTSLLSANNSWTGTNTFTNNLTYKIISSTGSILKIISFDPLLTIPLGNTIFHGSTEFWSNLRLVSSAAIKSYSTSNATSGNNLSGFDDAGNLEFHTSNGNSGGQRRMIISENGNVLIGSGYANNDYLFSVSGTSNLEKLTVKNTRQEITSDSQSAFSITINTAQISYLSYNGASQFISFTPLGANYNYNIYEFRLIGNSTSTMVRFRGGDFCFMVDINNTRTAFIDNDYTKKYYKFQYIYQFPGQSVINTYYQLV